jgi:hypothetical protein
MFVFFLAGNQFENFSLKNIIPRAIICKFYFNSFHLIFCLINSMQINLFLKLISLSILIMKLLFIFQVSYETEELENVQFGTTIHDKILITGKGLWGRSKFL